MGNEGCTRVASLKVTGSASAAAARPAICLTSFRPAPANQRTASKCLVTSCLEKDFFGVMPWPCGRVLAANWDFKRVDGMSDRGNPIAVSTLLQLFSPGLRFLGCVLERGLREGCAAAAQKYMQSLQSKTRFSILRYPYSVGIRHTIDLKMVRCLDHALVAGVVPASRIRDVPDSTAAERCQSARRHPSIQIARLPGLCSVVIPMPVGLEVKIWA